MILSPLTDFLNETQSDCNCTVVCVHTAAYQCMPMSVINAHLRIAFKLLKPHPPSASAQANKLLDCFYWFLSALLEGTTYLLLLRKGNTKLSMQYIVILQYITIVILLPF